MDSFPEESESDESASDSTVAFDLTFFPPESPPPPPLAALPLTLDFFADAVAAGVGAPFFLSDFVVVLDEAAGFMEDSKIIKGSDCLQKMRKNS